MDSSPLKKNTPFIFAISGYKNSGKTTLITKLIPELKQRGYRVAVIKHDGHDFEALIEACEKAKAVKGQPSVIIAKTIKGKGVSFMENQAKWHGTAPNEEQLAQALAELGE